MLIEKIRLFDFRNYQSAALYPHPGVNLFFGQNGSGKTNLLEAVHYCALGRSHRTSQDREVVRRGMEAGWCGVSVRSALGRRDVAVRLMPAEARKKQVQVDGKRVARLSELMGLVRCVMFAPEDLMLVKEGPSGRRRFVDMMISQLSPGYFSALQQYQQALEQRNAILKQTPRTDPLPAPLLDAFEAEMARCCQVIIPLRRERLQQLQQLAADKYRAISGRDSEHFSVQYLSCVQAGDSVEELLGLWQRQRHDDRQRGVTGAGIHREDLRLSLNGREMKQFASQGQIRTAALSLKLAQLELFRQLTGEAPVLLLDDVMSELDRPRRTHLLSELQQVQTFVTCTDESDLDGCADLRAYHVQTGPDGLACVSESNAGSDVRPAEQEEEPDFD